MMRRGHTKSRKGCSNCKRRRVKCDEIKPECRRCVRTQIRCSFLSLPASTILTTNPASRTKLLRPTTGLHSHVLDTASLEIFHHYITTACLSLATPQALALWKMTIPQMGFSHTFLLHGILAVSALHLAFVQSSRAAEMHNYAARSAQLALSPFRRFVAEEKDENINAVFAFSGFVVPYVFATCSNTSSSSSNSDASSCKIPRLDGGDPHWFFVVRGHVALLARNWKVLLAGPFNPLLAQSPGQFSYRSNPDDGYLARVHAILERSEDLSDEEDEELRVCRVALDELRRVSALPYTPCKTLPSISSVYLWAGTVSDEYLQLVHRRKPQALIVLANYCVLLKKSDALWYLRGVGEGMLSAIDEELDDVWKPWIEWAVEYPPPPDQLDLCLRAIEN